MDTFTLMIALILMMLSVQFGENWLMFAVLALSILTFREVKATIVLVIAMILLYVLRSVLDAYWPFIFFGLIILAALIGNQQKQQEPEYYSPDMYGGMMGGG